MKFKLNYNISIFSEKAHQANNLYSIEDPDFHFNILS
jgi:hypothetical protein